MNFVLKMMNFAFQMMNFVLKMVHLDQQRPRTFPGGQVCPSVFQIAKFYADLFFFPFLSIGNAERVENCP